MKISPFRGGRGGLCTSREGAFPPPLCLFSNFLFTLTSALRDPLSQQHHQHLFPGPRRQGLRGLPREGSFTAGSGGDRQGLRWKGCGGGKACREMPGHPNVLWSSDHHRDGPREGSWSPSGFLNTTPTQVRKKIVAGESEGNSEKNPDMWHFFLVRSTPSLLISNPKSWSLSTTSLCKLELLIYSFHYLKILQFPSFKL